MKKKNPAKRTVISKFKGENLPSDFNFPSFGIEDIDRAVFNLFDKKLNFQITQKNKISKIPVVFAAGERFALTRRKNPIRDKNNTLILPLISIMRGDINFSPDLGGSKTAIAPREQESYIIKKRLSEKDRKYQNIINKQSIKNQKNVSSRGNFLLNDISPGNVAKPGTVASRRNESNLKYGSGLINFKSEKNLNKNIYEIIEIPYPEFVSITYDVVFWTQYLTQANEIMESLLVRFEGQGEEITYKNEDGFEIVAFFDKTFSNNNNFDNYTDEERIIKHSIGFKVPAYIINPNNPNLPNLKRSYFSAPFINFDYFDSNAKIVGYRDKKNKFKLSDVTSKNSQNLKRGQSSESIEYYEVNPFTKEKTINYSKVLDSNKRTGETVLSSLMIEKIDNQAD